MAKIICPKCGRVLGDAEKSLDANLNCRTCKESIHIKVKFVDFEKGEKNDKSK